MATPTPTVLRRARQPMHTCKEGGGCYDMGMRARAVPQNGAGARAGAGGVVGLSARMWGA